jgi:DnaJ-class molecular chaperone
MMRHFATLKMVFVLLCLLCQASARLCAMTPQVIPAPVPPVRGERRCTECNEEGMVLSELKGQDTRSIHKSSRGMVAKEKTQFYVPCKTCKGRKNYVRDFTLAERVEAYLKARERYDQEQLAARRKPVGDVYADAEALDALEPEVFATLAVQHPVKCKKCYGFAKTPCTRCKSLGVITKVKRMPEPIEVQETCTACDGEGSRLCKPCNGSGLARLCTRCKGRGVQEKPAKKQQPAVVERCKSCLGMGRR